MSLVQSIAEVNDQIDQEERGVIKRKSISFIDFFTHRRIFFATMAGTLFQYTQSCLEPVFVLRLKEFDLPQVAIGGIYTITPLMFIVGNIIT